MIKIAPSILSADFVRLGEEVKAAEEAGAHLLHIDVMDGHFVPNITIGWPVIESLKKCTKMPFDVHLMISEPDRYLNAFIKAGADFLTVHYEAAVHLHRTIHYIKDNGIKAGVSINPATPVGCLEEIIGDVDLVLLMSVNPGFGGQKFIPGTLSKLKQLRALMNAKGSSAVVEVDGGVTPDNAKEVADAGADILVMGSAFFNSGNYRKTMERINEIFGNR